jgi:four helix bundle protein
LAGFEQLVIWRRGMALVPRVYRVVRQLPKEEEYVLKSQIRRAAISVPLNIAEGYARRGKREFARFVSNAQGSLAEFLTELLLVVDLGYVRRKRLEPLMSEIDELSRMLNASRRKLLIPNP